MKKIDPMLTGTNLYSEWVIAKKSTINALIPGADPLKFN